MREIGSEFWDAPITNKENGLFPKSTKWFLSGRSALKAIIRELQDIKMVSMPSWCCDSMVKPFEDEGILVRYYPVYWRDRLIQEIDLNSDALFIMDYFGYAAPVPDLSGYEGIIIRDVTHSIFSASYSDADFYFGSLRKWCGVWTGGYAWGKGIRETKDRNNNYIALRRSAMETKAKYIKIGGEKGYLKKFEAAENMLENTGDIIYAADERDIDIAIQLDVELIRNRRRKNAGILMNAFSELLVFPSISDTDCPMFVPIFTPEGKRDSLRQYLIDHSIYCPIHWPNSDINALSLVCDQRYTDNDMIKMVEIIKKFWQEA